jgi:hypothetical protein
MIFFKNALFSINIKLLHSPFFWFSTSILIMYSRPKTAEWFHHKWMLSTPQKYAPVSYKDNSYDGDSAASEADEGYSPLTSKTSWNLYILSGNSRERVIFILLVLNVCTLGVVSSWTLFGMRVGKVVIVEVLGFIFDVVSIRHLTERK